MSVPRHHIGIEFLEKLCASLVLAIPSPLSALALLSLGSRRLRWRRSFPAAEQARAMGFRETCLLLAAALGLVAGPSLKLLPFSREISSGFLLILMFGVMFWGESAAAALLPRPRRADFRGPGLANLGGWVLLSFSVAAYVRGLDERGGLLFLLAALATSLLPTWMAQRNGEPGLLIPASLLYFLGLAFGQPVLAGLGAGVLPATLVWFTYRVSGDFPLRGLAAAAAALAALQLPASQLPALAGVVAAALLFALTLPTWRFWLRFVVLALLRVLHRFKLYGTENLPYEGPALLVSNHVSMIDGWLVAGFTQRFVRFLVYDAYYKQPAMKFGLDLFRSIPISQGARRDAIESLRRARHEIVDEGHVAGIFPEGGISRAGYLQPFQKGFTRVLHNSATPIVPAYMNGLWTNFLSFGEFAVGMRVPRFFKSLEIEYGKPLPASTTPAELWRQVKHLEVEAAFRDSQTNPILPVAFLEAARRFGSLPAIQSPEGTLSYNELANRALLLSRYLRRHLREKSRVGVLLPTGPAKVIAYLGLALAGHVAFELEDESRGRAELGLAALLSLKGLATEAIFIDRFLRPVDFRDAASLWMLRRLSPHRAWRQGCKFAMRRDSAVAVVESQRGRAVLSHRGVWSAATSIRRTLWLKPGVSIRCQLGFGRAAGLQLGLWAPLLHGASLQFGDAPADFEVRNPRDADLARPRSGHVLVVEDETESTAEAMSDALGERFLPVFEVPELSGLLSLSAPPVTFAGETQCAGKAGTLGKILFGLEMRQDETSGTEVRGPGRFLRYLGQEEQSRGRDVDKWFPLPVAVQLDEHGFVERQTLHLNSVPLTSALRTSSPSLPGPNSSHPLGE